MHQTSISTPRLVLHHIPADGLISLMDDKSDLLAIAGRDISNPYRVLIDDEGPLPWRVPQVKEDPEKNKWFLRFITLAHTKEIIGSTSFHGAPDADGMIEIGIGLDERFWGKGYAKEALKGMWLWVCNQPGVTTLRYTVSPSNIASVKIIEGFGFAHIGQQMDEVDGPEDIYEMSAVDFLEGNGNE
ncbi:MAG: GNAT family N-acetyltransferase [Candidatus Planktophila sp.]